MVWSLTLPVIWHLKLNRRQKLSLSAIFTLGLLWVASEEALVEHFTDSEDSACVASIVRVTAFNQVDFNDITYTLVTASIWTTIEQSMGIICACLPTTRPLMGRLFSNIQSRDKDHPSGTPDTHPKAIPLPTYTSRPSLGGPLDNSRTGFARLEEENLVGAGFVTTDASRISDDDLPTVPDRIVKQQKVEQHFEEGTWPPGFTSGS